MYIKSNKNDSKKLYSIKHTLNQKKNKALEIPESEMHWPLNVFCSPQNSPESMVPSG